MSSSPDFNSLAAAELRIELGHDHVAVRSPADYPEDGVGDGRRR
jgi:hypothetical protein